MKYLGYLLLAICCLSCNAVRVYHDYEKEVDFSAYTTYNYYPDMDAGMNELDTKRLLRVLDSTMQMKGFLLSEEPDFLINIQSKTYQGSPNNTVGVGVGGTGRNVGGGLSVGLPLGKPKLERQIQFDLIDSQRDVLYWQGISESSFRENASPSVKEEKFRKIVQKVFDKYPLKTRN